MNTQRKKFLTRKKVAGGLSIILIVALLLGGTYAWSNFTQHKTNLATGGQFVDVTLNDSYTPPTKWVEGQTLDKQVSVTNPANSTDPVYVRLQFKEYLERFEMVLVDNGALFATYADDTIGTKGDFMTWSDAVANGYDNYTRYIVVRDSYGVISTMTNPSDDTTPVDQSYLDTNGINATFIGDYCLTNNAELRNGIYGKQMYVQSLLEKFGTTANPNPTKEVFTGSDPQTAGATNECNYPVNKWWEADGHPENCDIVNNGDKLSKYINWQLGTDVITMQEWKDGGATLSDGTILDPQALGDFWVLDTTDGWAYWANPIQPGESTANIMDSITLVNEPGSQFEYQIHIDQQAVTQDDLDLFADTGTNGGGGVSTDGQKIIDVLKMQPKINSITIATSPTSGMTEVAQNSSQQFEVKTIDSICGAANTVTWLVTGMTSAGTGIDPDTGLLTVANDEPIGTTLTVTATSTVTNPDGTQMVSNAIDIRVAMDSPAVNVAPGETFIDSAEVVWRVLADDGNGHKLITTEYVYGQDTLYYSATNTYKTLENSDLRGVLDSWYTNSMGEDIRNVAVPFSPNPLTDVRSNYGGFDANEIGAAGMSAAGTGAAIGDNSLMILSLSEFNTYVNAGTLNKIAKKVGSSTNIMWWLRSPGATATNCVAYVQASDKPANSTNSQFLSVGFRPALWING